MNMKDEKDRANDVENKDYCFWDRDVSWLSFNKRVLLESLDQTNPIYERLNFLSIFSSNLEEFYQIRVAGLKASIERRKRTTRKGVRELTDRLQAVTKEVKEQEMLFRHAWEDVMVPDFKSVGVDIYTDFRDYPDEVKTFVRTYFLQEIFPFIQPVCIAPTLLHTFIRDKRIYLCVEVIGKSDGAVSYYMIKLPFTKAPRFLQVPSEEGRYAYTFLDEVIRLGLPLIFPGYNVSGSWSFKISRDADVVIDEDKGGEQLAQNIEELISKRKIGDITRFQYDDAMPSHMREMLQESFGIHPGDMLVARRHLQLQDLRKLPNPLGPEYAQQYPAPIPHLRWEQAESRIDHILAQDEALYVPYVSFQYLLDLLDEACFDERVKAIKLTQYRVAEDSEVIDTLIKAATHGKEVTVFVELKARFDEENNLITAQRMIRHGIKIIYSLPKLKVHAKTSVIEFHEGAVPDKPGIAIFSTGNFNEKTAKIYSDITVFSSRKELSSELIQLFRYLEDTKGEYHFNHLLVASKGMVEHIHELIEYETNEARHGRPARMVLKMNSLEEKGVIAKLYEASEAGVQIDLLVRGICRLVPNQPYSRNIRVIRLVDIYLEHARIWYFYHGGDELYFVSSADWMRRNLYRRIECAAPIVDPKLKKLLHGILELGMADTVKAVYLDEHLNNVPKKDGRPNLRTQKELYNLLGDFVKP